MKTVKLNRKMVALSGEAVKDQRGELAMNELVAEMLASAKATEGAVRQHNLSQAIFCNGNLELEDADYDLVKKVVLESGASTLIVAQIYKAMDMPEQLKDKKDK